MLWTVEYEFTLATTEVSKTINTSGASKLCDRDITIDPDAYIVVSPTASGVTKLSGP